MGPANPESPTLPSINGSKQQSNPDTTNKKYAAVKNVLEGGKTDSPKGATVTGTISRIAKLF